MPKAYSEAQAQHGEEVSGGWRAEACSARKFGEQLSEDEPERRGATSDEMAP